MPTKINSLSQLKGLSDKRACLVATVGNISFTGITQIDGVNLTNGDRVLVWQQSTPSQNGIYVLSGSTNLIRALDSKNVNDFIQGTQYLVVSGNTYSETLFYLKNKVTTLGVDDIIIDIFGGLNGTSGTSGTSGSSGTSGGTGSSGASGSSGTSATSGSSGTSGSNAGITSYTNPADNRVITSVSSTSINAEANLTFDGSILDVNTTAAFKLPVGTTAERPGSPTNGMIRLNTTLGGLEVYDSDWYLFYYTRLIIDYLVIAGGGGGASTGGGGGGAGGYRTTVGTSGGNSSSESKVTLTRGVQYVITVGAGAPQNTGNVDNGFSGSNSSISGSGFTSIISIGGGGGSRSVGINGGSGGGGGGVSVGGLGTINQGTNGGAGAPSSPIGGGGGGASTIGVDATSNSGGNGGNGLSNDITGTSIVRAGGGGGGNHMNSTVGSGGTGGGGTASPFGSANARGTAGTINTGSGGGGGSGQTGVSYGFGGAGGSGIVIIKTPIIATITTGSPTITSFGTFYIYQFTGTGTITF